MKAETVWLEHNKELKRFVLSKVKDKETAEDLLQDVFLKLHAKIGTLNNEEKIRPWLFQVTRNVITDHFRKQKFNSGSAENISDETETSNGNDQFLNCIPSHINKLPLKYKEALVRTELQNYSQLQLADELKISYSGAKSRVQRAKELLKKYFNECCNISSDKYGNILNFEAKHECKLCN